MKEIGRSAEPACVSMTAAGRCRQLEVKRCGGEECPFMKTRAVLREEEIRVYERLASLDEETQERISLKYYHGTRPWQPRGEGGTRGRGRRKTPGRAEPDGGGE